MPVDICSVAMGDTLCLSRAGRHIRSFPLGASALELGSDPDCDIVIHAAAVPRRSKLFQPHGGTVFVYDLEARPGLGARSVLPIGRALAVGASYAVTRLKAEAVSPAQGGTELLHAQCREPARLSLIGGHGAAARAFHLGDEPISLGGASDNAMTLSDRAVSRYHCRIEPSAQGVCVRDLGSTNGTWVDGLRIRRHQLRPGAVLRMGRTELRVVRRCRDGSSSSELVVESTPMLAAMADVDRFATLPWPVLIHGETGVGKEHVARALHERGVRRAGPFVPINGGGLPRELIESELFGHERGAFTGAVQTHRGAFEQAHGGTLFLDEVAELAPELQTRLLRVLETWEVRRVGSESARRVDVRLLCATHRDLRAMVRAGRFRSDLYYRIHRLLVEVPALRARPDDIAPLAAHFIRLMEPEVGERRIAPEALERLRRYTWPGNVRELRNLLELAAVDCDGALIDLASVERALRRSVEPSAERSSAGSLRETLQQYGGNLSAAARALGIPRSTLRDRLQGPSEPDS
ncbi:MAG: sigma 54-dependent Fis family transcriptional regulator [Deltaproteobacteria bacterium]|nr:MAG: sigma 54-dependent Fis family transcriptional regulator [Deltaproteobacteria bacterium]